MHIARLARTENELLTSPLEDKLRFVFREHVRGAVVLLRQLLLPLHHFAGEANDHIVLIGLSVNRDGSECRTFDLHSPDPCSVPKHSASGQALVLVGFCRSFFVCFWAKCEETWECDEFPRARTSFECALHFRTTRFASVGDTLKTVGKQDRRDFPYCHLAFAIRTDFHRGYYRTCQLGTHDVSFRPT